jgi:hypothetical protein
MNGRLLNYHEQLAEVVKYVIVNYHMENDQVVKSLYPDVNNPELLTIAQELFSNEAHFRIKAPFRSKNPKPVFQVPELQHQRSIIADIDKQFFAAIGITVPDENARTDTLFYQTYKSLSLYHVCFSEYGGNRALVNTAANMTMEKMARLYQEFCNPGNDRTNFEKVQKILPRALEYLETALEVKKNEYIVPFTYHPSMLKYFVSNPMSSAGVRPGDVFQDGSVVYKAGGKKLDQFAYYADRFHKGMVNLKSGGMSAEKQMQYFEYYCQLALKNEFKFVYPATAKKAEGLKNKCREFQIANMMQQFLSKLLMAPRQILERGDYIRIGQKWLHGGAQDFAQFLHAGNPRIVWHTGDFNKLDKSLKDYLLSLYVASGKRYFRLSSADKTFFDDLFVLLAEKIAVKMCNHVGGVWTMMLAYMYSGGYETSHGDSWCVLLVWFCYIVYTMDKYPLYAEIIKKNLFKTIRIVVYGDDHVWSTPKQLIHILNEELFGAFVIEFFDMSIRDAQTLYEFFSTFQPNGQLLQHGVVFLKRYFILNKNAKPGYACVLPFKPTHETLLKLFCTKDGQMSTAIVQAIGQAYDSLGTNKFAYDMVRQYFVYYRTLSKMTVQQAITTYLKDDEAGLKMRRLKVKIGGDIDRLRQGFPTWAALQQLHIYNKHLSTNKIEYDSPHQIYKIGEDDENLPLNIYDHVLETHMFRVRKAMNESKMNEV